jgi:hypothetical protein
MDEYSISSKDDITKIFFHIPFWFIQSINDHVTITYGMKKYLQPQDIDMMFGEKLKLIMTAPSIATEILNIIKTFFNVCIFSGDFL